MTLPTYRGRDLRGVWRVGGLVPNPDGTAFIVAYDDNGTPQWHIVEPETIVINRQPQPI